MGITIKTIGLCNCKKNTVRDNMKIIAQKLDKSKIEYLYQCPICKSKINISVRLYYDDSHRNLRIFMLTQYDETRLVIYVCYKCKKLIGTRENFYVHRKKIDGKYRKVPYCEGCHDNK